MDVETCGGACPCCGKPLLRLHGDSAHDFRFDACARCGFAHGSAGAEILCPERIWQDVLQRRGARDLRDLRSASSHAEPDPAAPSSVFTYGEWPTAAKASRQLPEARRHDAPATGGDGFPDLADRPFERLAFERDPEGAMVWIARSRVVPLPHYLLSFEGGDGCGAVAVFARSVHDVDLSDRPVPRRVFGFGLAPEDAERAVHAEEHAFHAATIAAFHGHPEESFDAAWARIARAPRPGDDRGSAPLAAA